MIDNICEDASPAVVGWIADDDRLVITTVLPPRGGSRRPYFNLDLFVFVPAGTVTPRHTLFIKATF